VGGLQDGGEVVEYFVGEIEGFVGGGQEGGVVVVASYELLL
jgi:hypothetical protein